MNDSNNDHDYRFRRTLRLAVPVFLIAVLVTGSHVAQSAPDPTSIPREEVVYVLAEPGATVNAGEVLTAIGRSERAGSLDIPEIGVSAYWTPGRRAVVPPDVRALTGVRAAWRDAIWSLPAEEMAPISVLEPMGGGLVNPEREPFWAELWNLRAANVPAAWAVATGLGAVVGVIDTGVDCRHVDIACSEQQDHYDATRRMTVGVPTDRLGHGTHVAGIIAGQENGRGIIGVAPNAEILSCKACSDGGRCAETDVAACIVYLAPRGVAAVNMSLGGSYGPTTPALCEAMAWAAGAYGVLSVASVGNSGPSLTPLYPATCGGAVGVAASIPPDGDRLADYSQRASVDLTAPGSSVLSSLPNDRWGLLSGTSMAAPHVAGAAALLHEAMGDDWDPAQAAGILQDNARRICGPVYQGRLCGWGALDMDAAVRVVMPAAPETAEPTAPDPTDTPVAENTPTSPPTATHVPAVQTAIAELTQSAESPTPSSTPQPTWTVTPTGSRTPTASRTPTTTLTPEPSETLDPVALTVTALWPTATPNVAATLTALAPTPDRIATAVWATLRAPGAAETRAAGRRRLYLPGLIGPSPATATPEPTEDACRQGQPWECPAKTREAMAASELATIVAATAQAHATFWAAQTPMPTPIPTRDWPLAAPRARHHD